MAPVRKAINLFSPVVVLADLFSLHLPVPPNPALLAVLAIRQVQSRRLSIS